MAVEVDQNLVFLVVDDQFNVRRLIANFLRSFGYRTIHDASDGFKALAKLRSVPIGFIICDWAMPSMNGLAMLKEVRADPELKDIPFLMVTAEVSQGKVAQAVEVGVDDYITKPFPGETLRGKIEAILEKRLNPTPLEKAMRLGERYLNKGDVERAARAFETALGLSPDSPRALLGMGESMEASGRDKDAIDFYDRSVKQSHFFVEAHERLAKCYEKKGEPERAAEHMRQAVQISPFSPNRQLEFGKMLLKQGKHEEAAKAMKQAQKVSDNDPKIMLQAGEALLAAGQSDEAAKALHAAVEIDPNLVHVFNRLGIAFRREKRYDAAVLQYQKALEVSPDNPNIYFNLAVAYAEAGKLSHARRSLYDALKIKPDFKDARDLLQKLPSAH